MLDFIDHCYIDHEELLGVDVVMPVSGGTKDPRISDHHHLRASVSPHFEGTRALAAPRVNCRQSRRNVRSEGHTRLFVHCRVLFAPHVYQLGPSFHQSYAFFIIMSLLCVQA